MGDKSLKIEWFEGSGELFGSPVDSDYEIMLVISPGEEAILRFGETRRAWHWRVRVERERSSGGSDTLEQAVSEAEEAMHALILDDKLREQIAKRQEADVAMKRFLRRQKEE